MKKLSMQTTCKLGSALAGVLMLLGSSAFAADNPNVLRPHSGSETLYGKTYGEWSAEHWKWVFSMPTNQHPLFDTADASAGQSGDVWFLGGTFTTTANLDGTKVVGEATRSITIPSGKALFFPIVNAEGSTIEGNGATDAALRDVAESFINGHAKGLSCVIDGRPVKDLDRHLVESPLFTFGPLPANNNVLGNPAFAGQSSAAVSSGYFVMVAPLSTGTHTIHFTGKLVFTQEKDGFDFTFAVDITYHVTVE